MTKKHYKALAAILRSKRELIDGSVYGDLVAEIAVMLAAENPRSDIYKFREACFNAQSE